jgi:hypothetical protein
MNATFQRALPYAILQWMLNPLLLAATQRAGNFRTQAPLSIPSQE